MTDIDEVRYKQRLSKETRNITWADSRVDTTVLSEADFTYVDSRQGIDNPRYRWLIRHGQDATTPFSGRRELINAVPYYITDSFDYVGYHPNHWSWREAKGDYPVVIPHEPIPASLLTKADNRAKTEFVRKIRAKQTAFEGGTFLGELARTIRMIKNPAQGLRKGYSRYVGRVKKHARTGRRLPTRAKRIKELTKIASDTWLEYEFGWKQLIRETRDAVEALRKTREGAFDTQSRVIGFGEFEEVIAIDHDVSTAFATNLGFTYDKVITGKVLVKYFGGVGAGPSAAGFAARRVGLGPSNWLPTAWELVPYSFVVDYFSNVGDIISALSLAKSSLRWGCRVERSTVGYKYQNFKPVYYPDDSGGSGQNAWVRIRGASRAGAASSRYTTVERGNISSLVPSLAFSMPFSGTQWINLSALLSSSKSVRKLYRI